MRKRRHRERLILIAGLVVVAVIIIVVILLLVLNRKKLEYLTLTPTFQETELDVNSDYVFMVTTEPEGIKLKDLEYSVDDPTAVFSTASEDNTQAVLHTGAEGTVNIFVKQGDVVSNYMSFSVVDITAQAQIEAEREAQEQAELEAQQQALEAEQAAAVEEVKLYVRTTSKVRVRSSASTASDDNIITTVDKGTNFVKTGETSAEDGAVWVSVEYEGQEGFIRSDMVEDISEDEYNGVSAGTEENTGEQTAEENKPEEKKPEEKKPEEQKPQQSAEEQAAAAAAKAAADAQKAQEEAAAAALAQQQAQLEAAAAAQAAAAAAGRTIQCTDGSMVVTPAQYQCLEGYWSYTGDTDGMISHHSKGEIQQLLSLNGL